MNRDEATYRHRTSTSTRIRAAKSMPSPGTRSGMPEIRSASPLSPRARAASTACCWVVPGGSRRPITPAKIRSVACPRIYGPTTARLTPATVSPSTVNVRRRSGPSRRSSRVADGQKSIDFSAGCPAVIIAPGPRIGAGRGGACWLIQGLRGIASAASEFVGWSCDGPGGLLRLHDLGVRRAAGQQRLVGAEADHLAVVQHHDLVGVDD